MTKKNSTPSSAAPAAEEAPKTPKMTVTRRLAFQEGFVLEPGSLEGVAIAAAFPADLPLRVLGKLHAYAASGAIVLEDGAALPTLPEATAEPAAQ